MEDFEVVCKGLYRALCIREKHMQQSMQRFPRTPSQYLRTIEGEVWRASDAGPGPCRYLGDFLSGFTMGWAGLLGVLHRRVAFAPVSSSVAVAGMSLPSACGGGAGQAHGVLAAGSMCLMILSFWFSVHPASEGWRGSL